MLVFFNREKIWKSWLVALHVWGGGQVYHLCCDATKRQFLLFQPTEPLIVLQLSKSLWFFACPATLLYY